MPGRCSLALPGDTQVFLVQDGQVVSLTPSPDLFCRQVLPSEPSHAASGHCDPSLPTLHRPVLAGLPSPWPCVAV